MLGFRFGSFGCALLLLICACGRIGVHLIPVEDPNPRDSGASTEAGPDVDGSGIGGGLPDGGFDGGGLDGGGGLDSGPMDAGNDASGPSCPVMCQNPNGAADCSSGSCSLSCTIGYQDCDSDPTNGCEMSTLDSVASCGMCGRTCLNAHGAASCTDGLCSPTCSAGFGDCDGLAANGCETDLNQSVSCGGCGSSCANAHGTTSCSAGLCAPTCASGYDDCDGIPDNGCEADVAEDPMHCGSCTNVCNPASEICVAGQCQPSPCPPGQGECDGNPAVNCETDVTSSAANCGFCGNTCQVAHGSPSCSASTCGVASCSSGYANCDGQAANGCEIPLATTTAHCGTCATACSNAHGTTSCVASTCAPSCGSGFGDCDTSRPNGCETALNTVSNCGMCGKVCPANGGTPQCSAGVCKTVCDLTGIYALKLSIPTTWPSTSLLSSGNGTFVFWARVQLTQSGTSLTGSVVPCGQTVPDFSAAAFIGEKYGVVYPNTIYDRVPLIPSTSTSGTLGGTSPGSTFALGRASWLFGSTMADPNNGAWPSFSGVMSRDDDADSKPAVTANYKTGSGYSNPPTNNFGTSRATRGYLTARMVFNLGGTFTSCTQASGSATVQDIDVHTMGCKLTSNSDCQPGDTTHLDSNAPNYQTGASTYTLTKLANTAVCSDVRSALP